MEFLEEVRQKQRAEEEKARREIEEGMKAFRERQKGGAGEEEKLEAGERLENNEEWGIGRKRKRVKEKEVKGVRRKASEGEKGADQDTGEKEEDARTELKKLADETAKAKVASPPPRKASALVDYGSDDSDDD